MTLGKPSLSKLTFSHKKRLFCEIVSKSIIFPSRSFVGSRKQSVCRDNFEEDIIEESRSVFNRLELKISFSFNNYWNIKWHNRIPVSLLCFLNFLNNREKYLLPPHFQSIVKSDFKILHWQLESIKDSNIFQHNILTIVEYNN